MAIPVVSIIGLPNVGKSTLFNRIIGERFSIVDDTPGVTRDRIYKPTEWAGRHFYLIDTGGFLPAEKDRINRAVAEQAEIAMEESDLVLFMMDAQTGPLPDDDDLVEIIRKRKRKVLLVVNKMDNSDVLPDPNDYYRFGLGDPILVSAVTGRNIGDLLDAIVEILPPTTAKRKQSEGIRIAVLGKPNVGKSSLVNALLGREKQVVDDEPGTTRDSIDSPLKYFGRDFILIDTAGLRKKARIYNSIEYYTLLRALKSIERADVALVLIDAQTGITKQDLKIAQSVLDSYKPMILVINKWDLLKGVSADSYSEEFYLDNPILKPYPLFFTSALTKKRLGKLLPLVEEVFKEANKRIPTAELNDIILPELRAKHPPAVGGRFINFYYLTQYDVKPPSFMLSCNKPKNIDDTYLRFIVGRIRYHFGFIGSPIRLRLKKKGKKD